MSRLVQIALSTIAALLAWQAVAVLAGPQIVPTPAQTLEAGVALMANGELAKAIGQTLAIYAGGVCIAAVVGIAAGLAMGGFPLAGKLFEPWMQALAATPRIAFVPLIIVALGVGFTAKLVIVFLGAVIPVLVNTHAGVASADPELVEMARANGASRRQIFMRVLLPGALPFIMAGLRIGATTGLVNAVVAELHRHTGLGRAAGGLWQQLPHGALLRGRGGACRHRHGRDPPVEPRRAADDALARRAGRRSALMRWLAAIMIVLAMAAPASAKPFRIIVTEADVPLLPNSVLQLAASLGYFQRAGVDVEIIRVQQTPAALAALRAGEGDMANVATEAVLRMVAGNVMRLQGGDLAAKGAALHHCGIIEARRAERSGGPQFRHWQARQSRPFADAAGAGIAGRRSGCGEFRGAGHAAGTGSGARHRHGGCDVDLARNLDGHAGSHGAEDRAGPAGILQGCPRCRQGQCGH